MLSLGSLFTGPASHKVADPVTLTKLHSLFEGSSSGTSGGSEGPVDTYLKVLCLNGVLPSDSEGCPNNAATPPAGGGIAGAGGTSGPGTGGSPGTGGAPGTGDIPPGGSSAGRGRASGGGASNRTASRPISEGAARAILAVFGRTRTAAGQPLGVIVNYDITLNGFIGQRVVIRWTLWSVAHGSGNTAELPEQWLQDRPVQTLIGQAESDAASPDFWIPLPREPGPFEVEVDAYNARGVRLADKVSQPFS